MSFTTVTGVAVDFLGNPLAGVPIYVSRAVGAGLITGGAQALAATSDNDGEFSFTLPQNSTATVTGSFYVNGTSFSGGVILTIPASASALLKDLAAVASFPSEGAVVQSNGTPLADLIGTFNFVGFTVELTSAGVARITAGAAVTDEQVQDALATFFPDSGAYNWEYDDAGNRVSLVIAPATTLVNGLLSAADKTAIDALGAHNAANGYPGLNGSGLLTESQIPSSIARDSETTAAIDAEANTRASADTDLQTNINAKIGGSTGATDNAILRADGTGGTTLQASGATVDDNGRVIPASGVNGGIRFGSFAAGIGASASDELFLYCNGVPVFEMFSAVSPMIRDDGQWTISGDTGVSGASAPAVGWKKAAAGAALITNGTSGWGQLLFGRVVTTKTSDYTVTANEVNSFFNNTGAVAGVVFTLPTPVVGMTYEFYRDANQTVTVDIGGSVTIQVGASVTTAGGNVTLDAVGSRLRVVAISTTQWVGDLSGAATFN